MRCTDKQSLQSEGSASVGCWPWESAASVNVDWGRPEDTAEAVHCWASAAHPLSTSRRHSSHIIYKGVSGFTRGNPKLHMGGVQDESKRKKTPAEHLHPPGDWDRTQCDRGRLYPQIMTNNRRP